jgi:hypothetical protein
LKGQKFNFVTWLIFWLMLSNVGSLGVAYATMKIYEPSNPYTNSSILWFVSISFAISDLGFNVSHHLLAMKYRETSKTAPLAIAQITVPQS